MAENSTMSVRRVARLAPRTAPFALTLTAAAAVVTSASGVLASEGTAAPAAESAKLESSAPPQSDEVDFNQAFLDDPANIESGKALWNKQCRHCHGKASYPGKAPKLKPRRYTADFVYDRVTNGFRKMPAWKDVYSREERMAVVAYVLSREFSP